MSSLFRPEDEAVRRIHDLLVHSLDIKKDFIPAGYSVQPPTRERIAEFVNIAFWTSLRSNEGRPTRFCAAVVEPENFPNAISFSNAVAFEESQIVKLAPAVPTGGCFAVHDEGARLSIWGFGRSRPRGFIEPLTAEVSEPGIVRIGMGPFQPFAILDGRSNPILESTCVTLPAYLQGVLKKTIPTDDFIETQAVWRECLAFTELARMILSEGHGGLVLIVPHESGGWTESLNPFVYRFAIAETSIRDAIRAELKDGLAQGQILQRLHQLAIPDDFKAAVTGALFRPEEGKERGIRATASLTGVDGAIVMTRDLQVLGFGAKISVARESMPSICQFRAVPGQQEVVPSPLEEIGGTRHQSAARFVAANKDSLAIVISQDRHLSVVHWQEKSSAVTVIRNAEWWV